MAIPSPVWATVAMAFVSLVVVLVMVAVEATTTRSSQITVDEKRRIRTMTYVLATIVATYGFVTGFAAWNFFVGVFHDAGVVPLLLVAGAFILLFVTAWARGVVALRVELRRRWRLHDQELSALVSMIPSRGPTGE